MSDFDPRDALGRLARATLVVGGETVDANVEPSELYERSLTVLTQIETELGTARERLAQIHERHVESAPGRRIRLRVIREQEVLIHDLRKAIRHLLNDPSSDIARRRARLLLGPLG